VPVPVPVPPVAMVPVALEVPVPGVGAEFVVLPHAAQAHTSTAAPNPPTRARFVVTVIPAF
ncbi:MAG TPA: hypothetical protein VK841_06375, partial [Polyangiaceae bacterium]|nr:hypothetical protein [Polyangiaceae bacterium]